MKNAKKYLSLGERKTKLEKQFKLVDSGYFFNPIKRNDLKIKIVDLNKELNYIATLLTDNEKAFINEYYMCEYFEDI